MPDFDKKSPLERLSKSLYSRTGSLREIPRHDIHENSNPVPESWDQKTESVPERHGLSPAFRKAYRIVFILSSVFLLIAIGVGSYVFFGGKNFVSVDNIDILVEGPASVAGGEPLSLDVSVVNKNTTDMQLVDLIAEYPDGTKDSADASKDLTRLRVSVGDISPQSVAQHRFSSLMFGEEGATRDIKFTAEYRTPGSNAIFYKEKPYHVTISSSPIIVSVAALDKVISGEPSDVTVTISSNTTAPVKNLLFSLDYPSGFSIVSSSPQSTYGDSVWYIGDVAPGAKKVISMRAVVLGEDAEEKAIHANIGIQSASNSREIATTIISGDHTFSIEKPFLGLDLVFDGTRGDISGEAGRSIHGEIIWTNNSADKITNAKISAVLSGNVLDKNSVSADGGFYDSRTNTITWQAGRTPGLDSIAPGDTGRATFRFSSFSLSPGESFTSPFMTVSVSGSGDRTSESGAPENITTAVAHSVKLVSDLSLSARVLRSQGPFSNTGPIPPKAGSSSTYTVLWTVTNTSNTVTATKVVATLPQYVSWTGTTTPADAPISYDQATGVVTWNAGVIPSNATLGSGAKQVAFKVSLTPMPSQKGTAPDIIGEATITGTDTFTKATIKNSAPSLSTRTEADLLFRDGDEIVQQ